MCSATYKTYITIKKDTYEISWRKKTHKKGRILFENEQPNKRVKKGKEIFKKYKT